MTDTQWVEWSFKTIGPPATMMVIFVVGLIRKWWVLGWQYNEKNTECLEWKSAYLRTDRRADKAADIAESTLNLAKSSLRQ